MCGLFNKMIKMQKLLIGLILIVNYSDGLISTVDIRRLMESILLLPTVVKGTDSRVGFGFHLGHHADIQTILEVGPQKFTKPFKDGSNTVKRMIKQFNYSNEQKTHPNIYGRLEEWKNDVSSPKIYVERTKFGIKNQFPIPSQPTELIGTHS